MGKLEEYNTYINGLTDKKYGDIKGGWQKLYETIKESDKTIQSNENVANSKLDLTSNLLSQYQTAFRYYRKILEENK